jgi:predicted esterase
MAFIATACGSDAKPTNEGTGASSASCEDEDVGSDCVCGDGDNEVDGVVACVKDVPQCMCDGKAPSKTEPAKKDAGSKPTTPDDTKPATPAKTDAGSKDAGGTKPPTTVPDAGGGGSDTTTPVATSGDPKIPEIKGDCPEFKDGTIMVAGHKSIAIKVGAAGKGGPIVFYWHGTGSSSIESGQFAGNGDVVAQGGIVAAFNSSGSAKMGQDCSGTGTHYPSDFDAADQIVACGVKNHGINPKKIYTTGCSAGGLQAGCMSMMRSGYIAAVAPNSGGIVAPRPWQDAHSPAVFTMHGGSSDMVIVTFSETSKSFDMAAKSHGSLVVNCDHQMGHCAAPGDLQKAAWKFMQDNPYGVIDSPWKTAIPAGVPSYCKIF